MLLTLERVVKEGLTNNLITMIMNVARAHEGLSRKKIMNL